MQSHGTSRKGMALALALLGIVVAMALSSEVYAQDTQAPQACGTESSSYVTTGGVTEWAVTTAITKVTYTLKFIEGKKVAGTISGIAFAGFHRMEKNALSAIVFYSKEGRDNSVRVAFTKPRCKADAADPFRVVDSDVTVEEISWDSGEYEVSTTEAGTAVRVN